MSLTADYGHERDGYSGTGPQLQTRTTTHVLVGFGLFDWIEFDADLPVVVHQQGRADRSRSAAPYGLADVRLTLKGTVVRPPRRGFGLGLFVDTTAPTGSAHALVGERRTTVTPGIALEQRMVGGMLALANLGYLERPGGIERDAIIARAAILAPLSRRVPIAFVAELDSMVAFADRGDRQVSLRGGLRFQSRTGMVVSAFGGGAPVRTLGVASIQAGLSIAWAPPKRLKSARAFEGAAPIDAAKLAHLHAHMTWTHASEIDIAKAPANDRDRDGIKTPQDLCPNVAEDVDGYEDDDGCPDLDDDHDGIRDGLDLCPRAQEIVNGALDWDGCPDHRDADQSVRSYPTVRQALSLPRSRFGSGEATLEPKSAAALGPVAELLRLNPWMTLSLTLFVHAGTDPKADQALAHTRSQTIIATLQRHGVSPDRIEVTAPRSVPRPADEGAIFGWTPTSPPAPQRTKPSPRQHP